MNSFNKNILVGESYIFERFKEVWGEDKVITICPYCEDWKDYEDIEKWLLGYVLVNGNEEKCYSCSCFRCKKDFYLYV